MQCEGCEGMEKTRCDLGDVVEDEAVLPDHQRVHQAAQAQGVVADEPGGVAGVHDQLEDGGEVDEVAEVEHEQLTSVSNKLKISIKKQKQIVVFYLNVIQHTFAGKCMILSNKKINHGFAFK